MEINVLIRLSSKIWLYRKEPDEKAAGRAGCEPVDLGRNIEIRAPGERIAEEKRGVSHRCCYSSLPAGTSRSDDSKSGWCAVDQLVKRFIFLSWGSESEKKEASNE